MIDLTIQNIDKIKTDYKELTEKIERVTNRLEDTKTTVTFFNIIKEPYEELEVGYDYYDYGEYQYHHGILIFSVSWLSLTDNELADALYEYRKERERKRHEACLKAQEEKERAEYERLKEKFEREKE